MELSCEVTSGIMNKIQFEAIKSSIHLADNCYLEVDASKKNKMFKVGHLVEHLQNNFSKIPKD